jgi:hypothetical protein
MQVIVADVTAILDALKAPILEPKRPMIIAVINGSQMVTKYIFCLNYKDLTSFFFS